MENATTLERKKGRSPGIPTAQYAVMLEVGPAEWAKEQPGGLSEMLRKYLRSEYEKAIKNAPSQSNPGEGE